MTKGVSGGLMLLNAHCRTFRFTVLSLFLAFVASPVWADGSRLIEVEVQPVPLDYDDWQRSRFEGLVFRGGLHLSSPDEAFGGFSGLSLSADGRGLVALTDEGTWLEAELTLDEDGVPEGLRYPRLSPLLDRQGKPHRNKASADAEEILSWPGGRYLISFERRHRLEQAATGAAALPVEGPRDLDGLPDNSGIEAMARLADGRLLLISEDGPVGDGRTAAWIGHPGHWQALAYPAYRSFKPTSALTLGNGDVLVVERHFSFATGIAIRLVRFDANAFGQFEVSEGDELAILRPPLTIDNMEALARLPHPGGGERILLLSDDNFNPLQRTLLLTFDLPESGR
ncbi:MAG: esterase-like activity of phytase family protein [Magnetovibrionaceae bacterium]